MQRPTLVNVALGLTIAAAVLGPLLAMTAYPPRPAGLSDTQWQAAKVAGIIAGVIGGLLMVMFAFFAWRGKNWARIVFLVLTSLGVLSLFVSISTYTRAPWLLIPTLLNVVATVLFWMPATSAWINTRRGGAGTPTAPTA